MPVPGTLVANQNNNFNPTTGSIVSAVSVVTAEVANAGGALITIHGVYAGVTINFEVSDDNVTWYAVNAATGANSSAGATSPGTNVSQIYQIEFSGASFFRVRASAWTSGTATINITPVGFMSDPIIASAPTAFNAAGTAALAGFWNAAVVGVAGTSTAVNLSAFKSVTVMVNVSALTNITAQVSPDGVNWYDLNLPTGALWQITCGAAGNFAQPLPSEWAAFVGLALRLKSSAAATITAGYGVRSQ